MKLENASPACRVTRLGKGVLRSWVRGHHVQVGPARVGARSQSSATQGTATPCASTASNPLACRVTRRNTTRCDAMPPPRDVMGHAGRAGSRRGLAALAAGMRRGSGSGGIRHLAVARRKWRRSSSAGGPRRVGGPSHHRRTAAAQRQQKPSLPMGRLGPPVRTAWHCRKSSARDWQPGGGHGIDTPVTAIRGMKVFQG